MGQRGPPPKPQRAKKLEGTYRRDRDPAAAPAGGGTVEPTAGAPRCPSSLWPAAKEIWDEVVPELLELGTLSRVDGGILTGYCMMRARAEQLDALAAQKPTVRTPYGPKANPAAAEARRLWPIVEKFATDLGLHYAARSRVKMPEKARPGDPDEEFLFGKPKVIQGGKAG